MVKLLHQYLACNFVLWMCCERLTILLHNVVWCRQFQERRCGLGTHELRNDESRDIGIYLTPLQVWDFAIIKNESRLVTGCADSELRVWEIKYLDENTTDDEKKRKLATGTDVDHPEELQVL